MVHFSHTPAPRTGEEPAPGGPNDPGASASNDMQADTPGYSDSDDTNGASEDLATRPMPLIQEPYAPLDDDLFAGDQRRVEGLEEGPMIDSDSVEDAPVEPIDADRIEGLDP